MSVHNPRPAPRAPDPLPCALADDDDSPEDAADRFYDANSPSETSSSPPPPPRSDEGHQATSSLAHLPASKSDEDGVVDLSSSDDEAAPAVVVRRKVPVKVEKPQAPAPPFASSTFTTNPDYREETGNKGKKPAAAPYAAAGNKLAKTVSSSLVDYGDDDDDESEEEEKNENREKTTPKATAASKREVKAEKPQVPASPFAAAFAEDEKENRGKEDVGWEKTEDFKMEPTGCGVMAKPYKLPGDIFKMLYPHQREGLKWLWVLHCRGTGGILGDDMGLGKTMQISAFLAGLFHSRLIKRVLVVAPKTLLTHWSKELAVVGLKHKIRDYSAPSPKVRDSELQYAFKEGGILMTTYDYVRNNFKLIRGDFYNGNVVGKYDKLIRGDFYDDDEDEDGNLWDYVILDEGHIIKNPSTQRAKSLLEIPCVHRIVISGTPIQNNLKEMWALFYFCCPQVLGDKDEFKRRYESAIIRGNDKNATNREKHVGSTVAKDLRERIKPYFLRRMKSEVFVDTGSADDKKLSKKNELIVWLKLTACQRKLYEAFLNSDMVHSSMQGSPLAAITILKKICDHPMILTKKGAEGILEGMDGMLNNQDMGMVEKMAMNLADMAYDDEALQVEEEISCKLLFIKSLLRKLLEEGHHVLIFSQTRKMLNLIQEAILLEGYKFLRIDGTTKVSERERIVKDFQEGPGAQIFLLTTQVGGLGLTLTKAARVIVVDPAWNPSTDNQSVDRAYRIGQTKDVIVYRLMTSGTIEEKIYKLQVFKGALFRTATEQKEQTRYFSKKDIQELFSLPEQGFDVSVTQKQLQEEHGQQFVKDEKLRAHIEFLEQQGIAGVSNHSLLFSKTAVLPALSEHDALDSKPPSMPMMGRQYNKASSSDYVANGAAHAFKPKDFTPRAYSAVSSKNSESPEEIKAKINRLSQTLANATLVSRLPDRGDKLKKQIHELDEKLTVIESSPESASSRGARDEVICLDDQKYYDL
ncbi:hypothetical protein QYE76_050100 [Lolium multiflorum]|uniref:Protein CHROMATIN REMODELING 24 n=1 Tax=Lolium multiflorum TaxID=4521 RepID=A0AAD8SR27_LOLMU|nr:hypothetical protein QYE76_050100 [Lolium multiflorum]